MLKYLIILLDSSSVSFCHYENSKERNLIKLDTLREGILFAMKYDLKIQYVLPNYNLPNDYTEPMNSMFHDNIGSISQKEISDIIVFDGLKQLSEHEDELTVETRYIVRSTIRDFFQNYKVLKRVFTRGISANVVFTDVDNFTDEFIEQYNNILHELVLFLKDIICKGVRVNTNLLTDRIALDEMNNCGAGDTSITLAPDGMFYLCPAFYYTKEPYGEVGSIEKGLNIRNPKLFTLEGSPLCKKCDAYHCKRCVWLNKKLTFEVNVPSRQQCIMAHIERNASRFLLNEFHQLNILTNKEIQEIDYIDPFDKCDTWQ